MKKKWPYLLLVMAGAALIALAWKAYKTYFGARNPRVLEFILHPEAHQDWVLESGSRCADAPFSLPTRGFIGYLWDDSFKLFVPHQGIDIFGGTEAGITPVYAPYGGFLTREASWKSSLILRVPNDPLHPERQIWLYMTHLAKADGSSLIDEKFPAGSHEIPVREGELLGYMGNYSGDPHKPTGVHLHFSIVKDDGNGQYLNELKISNTLDPSPYFGLSLDAKTAGLEIPSCLP